MAQDGVWVERPLNREEEQKLRDQVGFQDFRSSAEEKLGKLSSEKASWQQHKDEQEAKVRRQHSLEQAASIVKTGIDWSDTDDSRRAGQIALELADKFSRWVESGELVAINSDRSSITQIPRTELAKLYHWLGRPNGSLSLPGVTVDAVEDGGILIRVQ